MYRTYTIHYTDGAQDRFQADLTEASAQVFLDDGEGTPLQTADGRHDAWELAEGVAKFLPAANPDDIAEVTENDA